MHSWINREFHETYETAILLVFAGFRVSVPNEPDSLKI